MFLIIFEDREMKITDEISYNETAGADAGIIDLVNMEDQTWYINGRWEPIEKV